MQLPGLGLLVLNVFYFKINHSLKVEVGKEPPSAVGTFLITLPVGNFEGGVGPKVGHV